MLALLDPPVLLVQLVQLVWAVPQVRQGTTVLLARVAQLGPRVLALQAQPAPQEPKGLLDRIA